jgi:hypothetical protein
MTSTDFISTSVGKYIFKNGSPLKLIVTGVRRDGTPLFPDTGNPDWVVE